MKNFINTFAYGQQKKQPGGNQLSLLSGKSIVIGRFLYSGSVLVVQRLGSTSEIAVLYDYIDNEW